MGTLLVGQTNCGDKCLFCYWLGKGRVSHKDEAQRNDQGEE